MADNTQLNNANKDATDEEVQEVCSICLDPYKDVAMVDRCFHKFCFLCIMNWTSMARDCPLCKTRIHTIIHEIDPVAHTFKKLNLDEKIKKKSNFDVEVRGNNTINQRNRQRIYRLNLKPVITFDRKMLPYPNEPGQSQKSIQQRQQYVLNKARLWLQRELPILLLHDISDPSVDSDKLASELSLMTAVIENLITKYHNNLVESKEAYDTLHDFFGENTKQFLSELQLFLQSPYDLITFDRVVKYNRTGEEEDPIDLTGEDEVKEDENNNNNMVIDVDSASSDDEASYYTKDYDINEDDNMKVQTQNIASTQGPIEID
eukprot:TRINITY_DN3877_c0_g1_i1.p1 TRINITY_DN3877_c0_g1~~TRINITY_DN3877_c0_g1_i1.p1  ORF type:complete len:318 (+),score=46.52 TRINITY_DN3877_c0_g1_i1:165-1118(+)